MQKFVCLPRKGEGCGGSLKWLVFLILKLVGLRCCEFAWDHRQRGPGLATK